jgi:hypothetical protein
MQPADLANRALDALGVQATIGDLEEGTREARVLLRQYGPCMRQLFRGAHWAFARRQDQLVLLQDATGYTTQLQIANNWPNTVGPGTIGMRPWIYEYRWPPDCVAVRFCPEPWPGTGEIPAPPPGNIAINTAVPQMTGQPSGAIATVRQIPRRFLVTNDVIPNLQGQQPTWNQVPDTSTTMGQGLTTQTVILCNHKWATAVYTALITYPDQWDPLFQEAFVALLAERCALALVQDRKSAIAIRNEQIQIAKAALDVARIRDGNEGFTTVDHEPDWIRIRSSGSRWGINGPNDGGFGMGVLSYGWDSVSFSDGGAAY